MQEYTISQYVNKALFDDKKGYYKKKNPIGKNADFITSPEISQVFGELLAIYLLQFITKIDEKYAIVEMGAGRGMLFYDVVFTLKKLAKNNQQIQSLIDNCSFNIIEINPVLRDLQKKKLKDFNVNFYQNLSDFAASNNKAKIIFFSNELLDCFAIDQYVLTESGWRERIIIEQNNNRSFSLAPFDKKVNDFVNTKIADILAPIGSVFEYSKTARQFIKDLAMLIKENGGGAINIDYGYYQNKFVNSLQGIKNHQKYDVLKDPGEVDITAHVDFGALDKIVKDIGLQTSFISQREFLLALGIEERRKILLQKNTKSYEEINLAIDRLIKCDEMGELFKVHIIWQ